MGYVTAFLIGALVGFVIGMIRAHKWWLVYRQVYNHLEGDEQQ